MGWIKLKDDGGYIIIENSSVVKPVQVLLPLPIGWWAQVDDKWILASGPYTTQAACNAFIKTLLGGYDPPAP